LSLWGAAADIHMMMVIATLGVGAAVVPTIEALRLMPVTQHWLPIEDGFEKTTRRDAVPLRTLVDQGAPLQPRFRNRARQRDARGLRMLATVARRRPYEHEGWRAAPSALRHVATDMAVESAGRTNASAASSSASSTKS